MAEKYGSVADKACDSIVFDLHFKYVSYSRSIQTALPSSVLSVIFTMSIFLFTM